MRTKVLVSGQNALIRESLMATFRNMSEYVMATTCDANHLHEQTDAYQPAVVLFSASHFNETLMQDIDVLKDSFPSVKILFLFSAYDDRFIIRGLDIGIDGFLMDDHRMDAERLERYLYDFIQDEHILSGKIAKVAMQHIKSRDKKEQMRTHLLTYHIEVTPQELDVLNLMRQRKTNKEMAQILHLKETSIRDYVSNAYHRIGIHKRGAAISFLDDMVKDLDTD